MVLASSSVIPDARTRCEGVSFRKEISRRKGPDRLPDSLDRNRGHALVVGALAGKSLAGLAGKTAKNRLPQKGRVGDMISRSEDDHRRTSDRLGQMKGARIVSDRPFCQMTKALQDTPGELGPEVDPRRRGAQTPGKGALRHTVHFSSQTVDIDSCPDQPAGDFSKTLMRPVLLGDPGSVEKDPEVLSGGGVFFQKSPGLANVILRDGEPGKSPLCCSGDSGQKIGDTVRLPGNLDRREDALGVDKAVDPPLQ
jgi:hypothetical protein